LHAYVKRDCWHAIREVYGAEGLDVGVQAPFEKLHLCDTEYGFPPLGETVSVYCGYEFLCGDCEGQLWFAKLSSYCHL
jgi:hypothetical protein